MGKNKQQAERDEDRSPRRSSNVSLAPLSPDDAIRAVFQIKPADVKRIVASKPGKKRKG